MLKIRYWIIVLWMLLCLVTSAAAQVRIGIGFPNVSIGINLPLFPELVRVPGYPVYYAPRVDANYFFYDGMYWVYQDDDWYASTWYNGPWGLVEPEFVPLYILRIPVRYYRQPPPYFRGWRSNAPPRWGEHWGHGWEQRRRGWDRWNRRAAPAPAPLPVYQRQYSGDRYPRQVEQQQTLRRQQYRYQPRNAVVRRHFQPQGAQAEPAQRGRGEEPRMRNPRQQDIQQSTPRQTPPQRRRPAVEEQGRQPRADQPEQRAPRSQGQERRSKDRGESREPGRDQGQGRGNDEDRGRERKN